MTTALERLILQYCVEYNVNRDGFEKRDGFIEDARREQAELVAALRMHEWHNVEGEQYRQCVNCGGDESRGHDADCATGKILARFPQ